MELFLLIIPVLVFVICAGLYFLFRNFVPSGNQTERVKGDLGQLSRLVLVLMTAGLGERLLNLSVYRRVTRLELAFNGQGACLTLPLITRQQIKRQQELKQILADHQINAELIVDDDGQQAFQARLEGTPQQVTSALKSIFLDVFDIGTDRAIQYEVSADYQDIVAMGFSSLVNHGTSVLPAYPEARTKDADPTKPRVEQEGCLSGLAMLFLWPVPFVLAFYWGGISLACIVGLVEIAIWRAYCYFRFRSLPRLNLATLNMAAAVVGYGLTIAYGEPGYVQLVPTIFCASIAVYALFALAKGRTAFDYDKQKGLHKTLLSKLIVTMALLLVLAIGAASNEYIRANGSLLTWVWYYAFFRLEILLGFLVIFIPALTWSVWREQEPADEAEPDTD